MDAAEALQRLGACEQRVLQWENMLIDGEQRLESGAIKSAKVAGQAADTIAQANGDLDKTMLKEVDSIQTGHLMERKDEVRAARKKLIVKSEQLCNRMSQLYHALQALKTNIAEMGAVDFHREHTARLQQLQQRSIERTKSITQARQNLQHLRRWDLLDSSLGLRLQRLSLASLLIDI